MQDQFYCSAGGLSKWCCRALQYGDTWCQAQTPDSPEGLGPSLDVLQSLDPEAQLADVSLQLGVTQIYSLS